jgi:hypothetical protein
VGAARASEPARSLFGELARWYHPFAALMAQVKNCHNGCQRGESHLYIGGPHGSGY